MKNRDERVATMQKVRLLCIGRDLSGGGAPRTEMTLLGHLDRSRFEIKLFYLCRDQPQIEVPEGLTPEFGAPVHALVNRRMPHIIRRLCALARQSDLLFATRDGRPIHLAVLAGRIARRPVVGWVHNSLREFSAYYHPWQLRVARVIYPFVDRMVAVSRGLMEDTLHFIPRLGERVVTLPNPLDLEAVDCQARSALPPWAERIFARKTLLAAGWLIHRKGFDILLEAFATVVREGYDVNLLILGEGPERATLEALARNLGLQDRVLMPGYQANAYPFFGRAELFVLSSRYEGLASVILEALSLGVPVVAADCLFGSRELLEDGLYGLLVPPEDPGALAEAIKRLLSSPELCARFRKLGPERARRHDAPIAARQFEALFFECLGRRNRNP